MLFGISVALRHSSSRQRSVRFWQRVGEGERLPDFDACTRFTSLRVGLFRLSAMNDPCGRYILHNNSGKTEASGGKGSPGYPLREQCLTMPSESQTWRYEDHVGISERESSPVGP